MKNISRTRYVDEEVTIYEVSFVVLHNVSISPHKLSRLNAP